MINRAGEMICPAYDELALGYRRIRTDASGAEYWRDLFGTFAFTISGPGVGARLGLDVDEVTAASVKRTYRKGVTYEMRQQPDVGRRLAGLFGLRWSLVRVKEETLSTLAEGALTITRAASAATAPRPTSGGGAIYIFADRRP